MASLEYGLQAVVEHTAAATAAQVDRPDDWLPQFLSAASDRRALELWFGRSPETLDGDTIRRGLDRAIAHIDQLIARQVNEILHHPAFQQLEAAWRGVEYLTRVQLDYVEREGARIKIRLLNVTWRELERDFQAAAEFDQSHLFKQVYEQEFGMPGGEPFGVLIADYQIHPYLSESNPYDDMYVLGQLAGVGAAAFCPVITNASPAMLELDSFAQFDDISDFRRVFQQKRFLLWNSLRDTEDARFLGLALPRVLLRTPYADDPSRVDGFHFEEDVAGSDAEKYLWGGAAFAVGEVLIRSFGLSGWLADLRGTHRTPASRTAPANTVQDRGGLVRQLPVHQSITDAWGVAPKFSTDVFISEDSEKVLSELGFLPLCPCKDTEFSVFYSSQSVQRPRTYYDEAIGGNALISSMLHHIFCASRFAHFVKVIARDKIGSVAGAAELQREINNWLMEYKTTADAAPHVKARNPLRDASVDVFEVPGKPGAFHCTMLLAPHYELDDLMAAVKLEAELIPARDS